MIDYYHVLIFKNPDFILSFFAILGLIVGFIAINHIPQYMKQLLVISIIVIIMCSSFVPMEILKNTQISNLQWPSRIEVVPQVFLTFIFSYIVEYVLLKKSNKYFQICGTIMTILAIALSSFVLQRQYKSLRSNDIQLASIVCDKNPLPAIFPSFRMKDNSQVYNGLHWIIQQDYFPKDSSNVFGFISYPYHNTIKDNQPQFEIKNVKPIPDGVIYKFNNPKNYDLLELPFVIYNKHYKVEVDGKNIDLERGPNSLL
ncbi:MAG: hypothetical protein Q3959_03515, partial [Limosilactobacillus sp.]|nr:hypothetical protein [Limosilactobacillus sp.]